MVSYQTWVSAVFEAVDQTGRDVSNIDDGASVMAFCARTWNRNKRTLSRATAAEADQMALQLVQGR